MRATTLKQTLKRTVITATSVLLIIAMTISVIVATRPVSADEYDDKIAALQADMVRFQAEADRLNAEGATLANALAQLQNERDALQAQVDLSQAQYDKLVGEIAVTEKQIKDNQDALGTILADLYVDDGISPVEMLASSQNIGDFLNKQEYRNAVKDQLGTTIKEVRSLKDKLTQQKDEVQKVLDTQKSALAEKQAREAQQANLLAQTQNNEANYQSRIKDSVAQIAEAKATQAAIRARLNNTGGYVLVDSGLLTAYPWNSANCPMWGYLSTGGANGNGGDGYGYGCRQCASYVAWRIARETGIYYNWGNAVNFTQNAINAGYPDLGMNPQPGSIAVMDPAKAGQGFGHVAWVEAVSGDKVTVSQYNYDYGQGYGMYSQMVLSKYAFDHYVKIK